MSQVPDRNRLIKDWTRFLIRNQVATTGETGALDYHRPVTSDMLMDFLLDEIPDLEREDVIRAMGSARAMPGLAENVLSYQPTKMDEVQVLRTIDAVVDLFRQRQEKMDSDAADARGRNLEKIKSFIEDSMTDQHRQALYHRLRDSRPEPVAESSQAGTGELGRIFKDAAATPLSIVDRTRGRRRLTDQELWARWKRSGRPRTSASLVNFLVDSGLSRAAAQRAVGVAGSDGTPQTDPRAMIVPLANYIIKNDLTEPVLDFLKTKFSLKESRYLGRRPKPDSLMNETLTAHQVLRADQYLRVLKFLKNRGGFDIPTVHAKRQIVKSWKSGNKSIKHIDRLLKKIRVKLSDIVK